jgi:hypothetical protein
MDVSAHQNLPTVDHANAGNEARAGTVATVHSMSRKGSYFKEGASVVEQGFDTFPRQQFSAVGVTLPGVGRTTEGGGCQMLFKFSGQLPLHGVVGCELACEGIHVAFDGLHGRIPF